jgi:hypothetical protein
VSEIELGGNKYRIGRMNAKKQWNIARRLMPVLAELIKAAKEIPEGTTPEQQSPENAEKFLEKISEPLADSFSRITDENSDYIIDTCLAVCERAQGPAWAPLMRGGNLMFQDLDMTTMLGLTFAVIRENLGDFFSSDQPNTSAPAAPPK